jgi:hypothetical protein
MFELLEQKEVLIDGRAFILSKFPAVAGREIIASYPLTAIPKIAEYKTNESIMLKLMCYVGVRTGDNILRLSSQALVDNHVGNWETLVKVEAAMLEYNCSFFLSGRVSTFLSDAARNMPQWILKILTGLSEQLSQKEKRP